MTTPLLPVPPSHQYEDHDHEDPNLDRGLAYDVNTLWSRRRVLGVFAGLGAVALAGCTSAGRTLTSSSTTTSAAASAAGAATDSASCSTAIPEETAGPYPGDGSNGPNVLDDSGIVRRDIRSSYGSSTTQAEGVPLAITLSLLDMENECGPMTGAAVYLWHCNRDGKYSLYSQGITNENYLRGVQTADANGQVSFESIFPACYDGRWPHIHFEVYRSVEDATGGGDPITTSQIALPKTTCDAVYATDGYSKSVSNLAKVSLSRDNVFGDDAGVHQLPTVTGDVNSGIAITLNVPVKAS